MAARGRWPWLEVALGLAVTLRLTACGTPSPDAPFDDGYDRGPLLAAVTDAVILPALGAADAAAQQLASDVSAYAAAVEAGAADEQSKREAAQASWRAAMAAWQEVEVMQLGPTAAAGRVGAAGYRDEVYSWRSVNPCRVDQELVDEAYAEADFFSTSLVNVYGLDALEYLLFVDTSDNACSQSLSINKGPWGALSVDDITSRRAAYADLAAAQVSVQTAALLTAWQGDGGFGATLSAAGADGSAFGSSDEALDDLMAAMFYVDLVTKDEKLALLSGLAGCTSTVCDENIEAPFADHSKENIRANLTALQKLYLGGASDGSGTGFDDYLRFLGHDSVADGLAADITAALAAVDALPGSLTDSTTSSPAAVRALYDATKAVTDQLKGEFAALLRLSIPQEGAGDSD